MGARSSTGGLSLVVVMSIESAQPLKKEQPTLITINKLKLLVVMMAKSSFLMAKLPMFP